MAVDRVLHKVFARGLPLNMSPASELGDRVSEPRFGRGFSFSLLLQHAQLPGIWFGLVQGLRLFGLAACGLMGI